MLDLLYDPKGLPTRGPRIKSGPNRGHGHPEKGGTWNYVGGRLYSSGTDERSAHAAWVQAVEGLGHIVGTTACDGAVSYYIWSETQRGGYPCPSSR